MVFDYYRDPSHYVKHVLDGNPDLPVVFFVSNKHQHHYNHEIFNLGQSHKRLYVMANDVPGIADTEIPSVGMSGGDTIENVLGALNVKAYKSNEAGVAFVVTDKEGNVYVHGGDLAVAHDKQPDDERDAQRIAAAYTTTIKRIAEENPKVDIAFMSVDSRLGDTAMRGAVEFIETVRPAAFFPMHRWGKDAGNCRFTDYGLDPKCTTRFHGLEKPGQSVTC